MRRVVITGIGVISPLGNNYETTWGNLVNGLSGANMISRFDTSHFKTKIACELKDYNAKDFLDRKDINRLDPVSHYALIAANEALNNSEVLSQQIDRTRCGVIWATGNGGASTYDAELANYHDSESPRFSPYFVPKVLLDTSSGIISIKHNLQGVNYTTVSACASGSTAIADAFNYIRWNKADVIVTGGSDAPICESLIAGFNSLKALSTENDDFAAASRPFDVNRDGFVMGEGAAALVLEEYEMAKKRGANIIAEVVGGGINADAYHMTAGHPEGLGAKNCMQLALNEAEISIGEIDYINAHATSTPVGDLAEANAIASICKDNELLVGATKSMTGHLMGAAGALEAAIIASCCEKDIIPPTINTIQIDPNLPKGIKLSPNEAIETSVNYALSNNFGFGGHNSCVVFKKFK